MNKNYMGVQFTDGRNDYEVIDIINIKGENWHRVKNYTQNRENEIYKLEQIETYLMDQFNYHARYIKNINYNKKIELRRLEEQRREDEEKNKYNFCHGFVDNKTDLQKGKILKALNQLIKYDGAIYTKKDWIEFLVTNKNITKVEEKLNTSRYSSRKINGCYEKLVDKVEYTIWYSENGSKSGNDLNKTEYQYALYLIEKLNIKTA